MKLPKDYSNYDIDGVRKHITELERYVAVKAHMDDIIAYKIINNLIAALKYSVNTIEFLKEQERLDDAMKAGIGSRAKN